MQLNRIVTIALFAVLMLVSVPLSTTYAAPDKTKLVLTVNITTDSVDKSPGDGKCANKNGKCSLRAAIMETNAHGGKNTINVPAGKYRLNISGQEDDTARKGDLDIRSNLTLKGAGARKTRIDGSHLDRIFDVLSGNVTITGVTVTNGEVTHDVNIMYSGVGGGVHVATGATLKLTKSAVNKNTAYAVGGIFNEGTLSLLNSTVDSNTTNGDEAGVGGIANIGTATIDQSNITNNTTAVGDDGGILNSQGTMTVTRSTIAHNIAMKDSGGIENDSTLVMIDTTISGNTAREGGGVGNYGGGDTALYNVTIANNHSTSNDLEGGGIYVNSGTVTWKNTIIASNTNTVGIDNCSGVLTSQDYNLMTYSGDCDLQGNYTHDYYGVDESVVKLGPLQNNGGPTMTQALETGSLAIDTANPAGCTDNTNTSLTTDQRGSARPTDGDGKNGAQCDIGAFEK